MNKIHLFLLAPWTSQIVACASPPKLAVESSIPARIEANGRQVCEKTPCTIKGSYKLDGYKLGCAEGGDNRLEAFPLDPKAGFRQSKVVYAYCQETVPVFFDMNSGGLVNTIVSGDDKKVTTKQTLAEKITELQDLKKQGLITESEYNSKKKELLDEFK